MKNGRDMDIQERKEENKTVFGNGLKENIIIFVTVQGINEDRGRCGKAY